MNARRIISLTSLILWLLAFLLGCEKEKESVRIGAMLPLTGVAAKYGESGKKGIDLAYKHFLAANPKFATKINIIYEDDKADPKTGLSIINKLTDIDNVSAIVGPMVSGVTLSLVNTINQKQILVVTPTSTSPKLRGASKFLFRTCVSDDMEGRQMAKFVREKFKIKKVGIIYVSNEYGLGLKVVFEKAFKELGGSVQLAEGYPSDMSDFRNTIQKLKSADIEAIYLIGQKEQKFILKQLKEASINIKIFGTTMMEDPDIITTRAADGIVYTYRVLSDPNNNPSIAPFFADYKKLYGKEPDYYAAANYDAATVVLNALLKVDMKAQAPVKVVNELSLPQGATGTLKFDDKNDVVQPFVLKTIVNGKFVDYK
jgi:branched-chain amino acid transport system substrate-binding protein